MNALQFCTSTYLYLCFLELNTFLRHLEKYKTEIKAPSSNVQFKIRPKSVTYVPLHGFSLDKKIPSASALCEYV